MLGHWVKQISLRIAPLRIQTAKLGCIATELLFLNMYFISWVGQEKHRAYAVYQRVSTLHREANGDLHYDFELQK